MNRVSHANDSCTFIEKGSGLLFNGAAVPEVYSNFSHYNVASSTLPGS